ncbi:MAG TPA: phosphoribosylamine--glycine ligase [Candidatus Binataceae bacterium]|nr:phosphoribosylamine--glycine ligase [Candidatus Binataceae bacterium]
MKVLVIGKGAREHALCWRLHQSESVWGLFCAPGNPGINQLAEPVAIAPDDVAALAAFAREKKIDLTIVGPDDSLAAGIVDEFQSTGLKIFGPTRAAAQLETSKSFAKSVMAAAGVATAAYRAFDDPAAARDYVSTLRRPVVVKADGLALGKGVTVCPDRTAALAAIDAAMTLGRFGAAGRRVVIEEFLSGEEVSFFALCHGEDALALGSFQDHKSVFDADRGPNTGGMGAYSPLPQFGADLEARVMREIIRPVLREMATRGTPFSGLLFAGLMVDAGAIKVIEFNARFGDPETEALMMRFESDLAATLLAAAEGRLADVEVRLSPRSAVTVILASGGYPGEYRKGLKINGLDKVEGGTPADFKVDWAMKKIRVKVFHAGTALKDGGLVTDGGRVLAVTAMAPRLESAVAAAYQAADLIEFEGKHLRRDIAHRGLAALRKSAGN